MLCQTKGGYLTMAEKEKKKKVKQDTAIKRNLQNIKKNLANRMFKSKVKTAIKSLEEAVTSKEDKSKCNEKLNVVYSLMDKGVKKNVYKLNKARRVKSRFANLQK
jgi:small subunit ribosomal protein S20